MYVWKKCSARGAVIANRGVGIRDRAGAERGNRGQGTTGSRSLPQHAICAEIKRMAAAAAAAAAAEGAADARGGGWGSDCSAAPVSPWPAIPGWGSANARARLVSPRQGG